MTQHQPEQQEQQEDKKPRFLVVGNMVDEQVQREDGRTRHHIGGVGGIMARNWAATAPT